MPMQPLMFGIPNCGTIKKARAWLETHGINYQFHDYKKQGVDKQLLERWLENHGWDQLINKRGTTWRKLDDKVKTSMNDELAIQVMVENPSIIRRPILLVGDKVMLGFDEAQYEQEFAS